MSKLSLESAGQVDVSEIAQIGYEDCIEPAGKRSLDIAFVVIISLLIIPLIAATCAALFLFQGRPLVIRHKRVGQGGREFLCLKFRTMVTDAEATLQRYLAQNVEARTEWDVAFKLKNDPRITRLGRYLRKTSLDELPQLWNILSGDMSVVGPRPIVQAEVARYGIHINNYYKVKPGLTGLWQVSGRSDVDYDTRVKLDVEYTNSRSIVRDLIIVLQTVPAVLKSRGSY